MTKVLLSSFFYNDPALQKHAKLKKGLQEYRFLLRVALLAVKHMQNKDLEKFDALVGENACQIRAVKIALMASEDLSSLKHLVETIEQKLPQVDALLNPASINALMHQGKTLKEVLVENNLDISLTEDEVFFIQCFILSEMKDSLSNGKVLISICKEEKSIPAKLKYIAPDISIAFLDNLASKCRKKVSHASVNFVQKTARHLQNKELMNILANSVVEHHARPCTPMFWTYKTLLQMAQKQQIPIIFHTKFLDKMNVVHEKFVYFCPSSGVYTRKEPSKEDLMKPALIIEGVACVDHLPISGAQEKWKKTILSLPPVDVILAGAADHRQYPNPEQAVSIEDEEYEHYQKIADKQGFSFKNPSTFFIQHVYSAQLCKKMVFCN